MFALDKNGNLVIIENKLDDSGRDIAWQVLRYVSYFSSLKSGEIVEIFNQYLGDCSAKDKLEDFFDSDDSEEKLNQGNSQKIIMVAGSLGRRLHQQLCS